MADETKRETEQDDGIKREKVRVVPLSAVKDFPNHPFQVKDDDSMQELIHSIEVNGVLNPVIARKTEQGDYELISGHRRKHACVVLGIERIPIIVREISRDEAVIAMVDSNLQRENILPSERAFAYKMKYDVLKRNVGRPKSGQAVQIIPKGKSTLQAIGEEGGDSQKQVQRYLRITFLIPELLTKLDEGALAFNPAVDISYLKETEQREMLSAMEYAQASPSISQAQRIKELSQKGKCTQEKMQEILGEVKKGEITRVMFKNEQLYRYFPRTYTPAQMKREIMSLLKINKEQYWEN